MDLVKTAQKPESSGVHVLRNSDKVGVKSEKG